MEIKKDIIQALEKTDNEKLLRVILYMLTEDSLPEEDED